MPRYSSGSSTETAALLIGETVELLDGANIIGSLVKANGQLLDKTAYAELNGIMSGATNYTDYEMNINLSGYEFNSDSNIDSSCMVGTDFYVFYYRATTKELYISKSQNGDGWTFPVQIDNAKDLKNVRVFGTNIFICTATGVFKYDTLTSVWVCVFNAISYDIGFDGVTYIIVDGTTALYKSTDLSVWVKSTYTGSNHSICYCGTSWVRISSEATTAYKSADSVTWATSALGYAANAYAKILYVNGNTIINTGASIAFVYSTDLSSWATGGANYVANQFVTVSFYNGTYYFGYNNGASILFYSGASLASTTALTLYQGFASGNVSILYNGSVCLITSMSATPYYNSFYVGEIPTAQYGYGYAYCTFASFNPTLGDGYFSGAIFNGTSYYRTIMIEQNGVFKLKKYSSTQTYILSNSTPACFLHYAKDVAVLYYYNAVAANSMTVSANTINENDLIIYHSNVTFYYITNIVLTTTGFVCPSTSAGQSTFIYGTTRFPSVTSAINSNFYVSKDGKNIIIQNSASPYQIFVSNNYGASFTEISPMRFSLAGASVAVSSNSVLYKLNGMFYSMDGYAGASMYVQNAGAYPASINGCLIQVNENLLFDAYTNQSKILSTVGGSVATVNGSAVFPACEKQAYTASDGSIYFMDRANYRTIKLTSPKLSDPTKFKVPLIPTENYGKAVYIQSK